MFVLIHILNYQSFFKVSFVLFMMHYLHDKFRILLPTMNF